MNRMLRILGLILTGLAMGAAQAAVAPDANERALLEQVERGHAQALALLRESVDINSGTMNLEGVRKVGTVFDRELRGLGFRTEWIDGAPFQRAGHLSARYGDRGPKILLIGHLDTVFASDSPFQSLSVSADGREGRGPGTTDMKGGDVILVQALRALKATGQLDRMQVWVMLMGDEENRGEPRELANRELAAAGDWADIALGFEDADGIPTTAATARRGASGWELQVTGTPAHSSQVFQPEVGYGAIYEAARILDGFRTALAGEPNLSFNPGVVVGGTDVSLDTDSSRGTAFGKSNVVAQSLRVTGDLRAISPEQLEHAREVMRGIVGQSLPGTSATIHFDDGYPPMAPTAGNARLLAMYDQVSRDLGQGPVAPIDPRKAGAADISFVANRVDMALDGLGLMGSGGHTVNEVADLDTLRSQTQRTALLLYRLAARPAP